MPAPPDPEDIVYEEEPAAHEVGEAKERDGADKSEIDKAPGIETPQSDQPFNKEVEPVKEETEPVKEETEPVKEEIEHVKEETEPVKEETEPVKQEIEPVKEETEPVTEVVNDS